MKNLYEIRLLDESKQETSYDGYRRMYVTTEAFNRVAFPPCTGGLSTIWGAEIWLNGEFIKQVPINQSLPLPPMVISDGVTLVLFLDFDPTTIS